MCVLTKGDCDHRLLQGQILLLADSIITGSYLCVHYRTIKVGFIQHNVD